MIPDDNDSSIEENYFLSEDSSEFDNSDCLSDEDLLWDNESFEPIDDFFEIESKVSPQEVKYVGNLYQFREIPRKQINDLITGTSELFESTLYSIKNEVCSRLGCLGATKECLTEIEVVFQKFEKPFTNLRTEKQRFSQFRYYDTFVVPENYKIGERTEYKSNPTGASREDVPVVAQFIPVRRVLKKFFEMPHVYDKTVKYINDRKSCDEIFCNIIQSPLWKKKLLVMGIKLYFHC